MQTFVELWDREGLLSSMNGTSKKILQRWPRSTESSPLGCLCCPHPGTPSHTSRNPSKQWPGSTSERGRSPSAYLRISHGCSSIRSKASGWIFFCPPSEWLCALLEWPFVPLKSGEGSQTPTVPKAVHVIGALDEIRRVCVPVPASP